MSSMRYFPSVIIFTTQSTNKTSGSSARIYRSSLCIIKFMISLTTYFDTLKKYYFHILCLLSLSLRFGMRLSSWNFNVGHGICYICSVSHKCDDCSIIALHATICLQLIHLSFLSYCNFQAKVFCTWFFEKLRMNETILWWNVTKNSCSQQRNVCMHARRTAFKFSINQFAPCIYSIPKLTKAKRHLISSRCCTKVYAYCSDSVRRNSV